jgi:hypothetical protein
MQPAISSCRMQGILGILLGMTIVLIVVVVIMIQRPGLFTHPYNVKDITSISSTIDIIIIVIVVAVNSSFNTL